MPVLGLLSALGAVAFVAVAVLATRDWVRRRSRSSAALAVALTSLAVIGSVAVLRDLLGEPAILLSLTLVGFALAGYAILEYGAALFGLTPGWRIAAAVGLVAPVVVLVGAEPLGLSPGDGAVLAAVVVLIGTWVVCVVGTAVRLWTSTVSAAPVQRAQLRMLGATFVILAVLVLGGVITAYATDPQPLLAVTMALLTAAAAVALYLAVRAPRFLRRPWVRQRTDELIQRLAPVGTWHYDVATSESWWSPSMRTIIGVDPDYQPGIRRYLELVHPDDRARLSEQLERSLREGRPLDDVYRIVRPSDGEIRWIRGIGDVFRDVEQNGVTAIFGTVHDVTTHKVAEEHLVGALERERHASEELRRLDEMKDTFLSAVSHELRTPLTALMGFAELLDEHPERLDEDLRGEAVSRIAENAHRLQRLLGDLLDLDRLARGFTDARSERVDLIRVIRAVLEQREVDDRVVHLDLPGDGVILFADPTHLERIVDNLVANALVHTPSGTSMWISVRTAPETVEVVVADDGPGVPDELKIEIFQRFRHGSVSPSRGAGVGLSLVAQFAALHGGRAWVSDRPGGGAAFHVELPAPAETARGEVTHAC